MAKPLNKLQKFSSKKIRIIEFYLTYKNNNCQEIAKMMGVSYWFVSNTVNEWLENNKTIIVASKL
jgi:transposase